MERREAMGKCPVCGEELEVTRLHCHNCDTALEGHFSLCKFCRLTPEQKMFAEVFLTARGNIKEVERILGISYPTVRGRLDGVIEALGYPVKEESSGGVSPQKRREILAQLDAGEISAEEAIKLLRQKWEG